MAGREQQQIDTIENGVRHADDLEAAALHAVRYEQTVSAKPPITVAIIPPRTPTTPQSRTRRLTLYRPKTFPSPSPNGPPPGLEPRSSFWNDHRRDSGRAPTTSTVGSSTIATEDENASTTPTTASKSVRPPRSAGLDGSSPKPSTAARLRKVKSMKAVRPQPPPQIPTESGMTREQRLRISMDIPSGGLFDVSSFDQMAFSNRGSILLGGKRAQKGSDSTNAQARLVPARRQKEKTLPPTATVVSKAGSVKGRQLSTDEETLSRKVRSLYDGDSLEAEAVPPLPTPTSAGTLQRGSIGERGPEPAAPRPPSRGQAISNGSAIPAKDPYDAGDGMEEWEEIDWANVDRYGFIVQPPRAVSRGPTSVPDSTRPHRVSTSRQLAAEKPRRRLTLRRGDSRARPSSRDVPDANASAASVDTPESVRSYREGLPRRKSQHPLRSAVNRLPGNKDRRYLDEAGDMLTLPPGLADIAEDAAQAGGKAAQEQRKKEWERVEKWRRMAKKADRGDGQGMNFRFDTDDPKLISRTWKGIPDCWRATAWHSFLSSSAQKRHDSPTDEALVNAFRAYTDESSPDDVQIDMDVPRTISAHIMFRRRYRGGQRLLFRVLHALSLYFPTTGYVQGMASLAATLLCYYDEESCFIMMVRLFQLRNLDRLYQPGFAGLVSALSEFEHHWLRGRDVDAKLKKEGLDGMVYGTRWYLTLFNYSIPFAAMLRVWDVFMLLGEPAPGATATSATDGFNGAMDILHATSAALIDGMREIVLVEDFEGVMKSLTGWIPVRDEEVLMRVVRTEWRRHRAGKI